MVVEEERLEMCKLQTTTNRTPEISPLHYPICRNRVSLHKLKSKVVKATTEARAAYFCILCFCSHYPEEEWILL